MSMAISLADEFGSPGGKSASSSGNSDNLVVIGDDDEDINEN